MNEDDANTIAVLKAEIERAWRMVDASQEKEAKAKENIQYVDTYITYFPIAW